MGVMSLASHQQQPKPKKKEKSPKKKANRNTNVMSSIQHYDTNSCLVSYLGGRHCMEMDLEMLKTCR